MQISRHWRMNGQRYRLEGVMYQNGDVSLQDRPCGVPGKEREPHTILMRDNETYPLTEQPISVVRTKV